MLFSRYSYNCAQSYLLYINVYHDISFAQFKGYFIVLLYNVELILQI